MSHSPRCRCYWNFGQVSSAIASGILFSLIGTLPKSAQAQIVPDGTLGSEPSVLTPNVQIRGATGDRIDGGALRGSHLFHSFSQFNVETLQRVYFSNPAGVQNILSRVTGGDPSNILGTLGVDGGANLFLINPRGIVFGPNARLDISGSFTASTAEKLMLGNGVEFSATNPNAPPLLAIAIQPGAQLGTSPTGAAIVSTANLSTGKDLTLAADKLDLQGQLQAGGDLTLLAQDTVKIRDSAAAPFVAQSGNKLLIQGNQSVDIFALNNSSSRFFAGGDMTLRSANAVGGDAHFWSGGNLRIEQLDGSLGDLFSPYDPVFQVSGDFNAGNFSGGSLQILAGGNVGLGSVTIIGSAPDFNNSDVTLSDGSLLTISGTTRPALEIRAGTTQFFGAPVAGTPTGSNIAVGDIQILSNLFPFPFGFPNPNGVVLLTNQVAANTSLPAGNITTGLIAIQSLFPTPVAQADKSFIVIDSRGDITTNGNLFAGVNTGFAGDIKLLAQGNITTNGTLVTTVDLIGTAGNIDLQAVGNVVVNNDIASFINPAGSGSGGNTFIQSRDGSIDTTQGNLASFSLNGLAGNITFDAFGDISVQNINASSNIASGLSSIISLTSQNGAVTFNGSNLSTENTGAGFAGDIRVTAATNVNILNNSLLASNGYFGIIDIQTTGNPATSTVTVDNSALSAIADATLPARTATRSGLITINAGQIDLLNNSTLTTTTNSASAEPGDITLTSTGNAVTVNNSTLRNAVGVNAGTAAFNFSNINIFGPSVILDGATIDAETAGISRGANVSIAANNGGSTTLTSSTISTTVTSTGNLAGAGAKGGNITISSQNVTSLSGSTINAEVNGIANGGDIAISGSTTDISNSQITTNLNSGATGNSGAIVIGNAQTSTIDLQNTTLQASAVGTGNSGAVAVGANQSVTITGGFVGTQAGQLGNPAVNPTGIAGDVSIQSGGTGATAIRLTNVGIDAASFGNSGKSGSVRIQATNRGDVTLVGGGRIIFTDTFGSQPTDELRIFGGNIVIDSYTLNAEVRAGAGLRGNGANIVIDGTGVEIRNNSQILTVTNAQQAAIAGEAANINGKGGDITILSNGGLIVITTGAALNASTNGIKNGGTISLSSDGGNIQLLDGSISTTVNLGATASGGDVFVASNGGNVTLGNSGLGTAFEINAATNTLNPVGSSNVDGKGGDILIFSGGGAIALTSGSQLNASTSGTKNGGLVLILSSGGAIQFANGNVFTSVNSGASGFGGSILVDSGAGQLTFTDNSTLDASTSGSGAGGNIAVASSGGNMQFLDGNINATVNLGATANGGGILIGSNGGNIVLGDSVAGTSFQIDAATNTLNPIGASNVNGKGGDIEVLSGGGAIALTNNSELNASTTGTKDGGIVTVNSGGGNLSFNNSSILTTVGNTATGNGGSITLEAGAGQISLTQGIVNASTAGTGVAGNLTISGNGVTLANNSSLLSQSTHSSSNGGTINLTTENLSIQNSQVSTQTVGGIAGAVTLQNIKTLDLNQGKIVTATQNNEAGSLLVNQAGIAADSITLSNQSLISLAGGTGKAGDILLNTRQLTLQDESEISATTAGSQPAGNLTVDANGTTSDSISLLGGSQISLAATGSGNAGQVSLKTSQLTLQGSPTTTASISASTNSGISGGIVLQGLTTLQMNNGKIEAKTVSGEAGELNVNQGGAAANAINLSNQSVISLAATGDGKAGSILLNTHQLTLQDGSEISAATAGNQSAGNLTVGANGGASDSISLLGGSQISLAATGSGNAGNVSINTLQLTLQGAPSKASEISATTNSGIGGEVNLQGLNSLQMDNGQIVAATQTGQAGNVIVNASNSVEMSNGSLLSVEAKDVGGIAGNLTINTGQFLVNNSQAKLSSVSNQAGSLAITANTVALNQGVLSAQTQSGVAGNVTIDATNIVDLSNGSAVFVSAGTGTAGSLAINTGNLTLNQSQATVSSANQAGNLSITANNVGLNQGVLSAKTQTGAAGSVTINAASSVNLSNGSEVSVAASQAGGTAGNLTIATGNLTVNQSQATVSSVSQQAGSLSVLANTVSLNQGTLTASTNSGQAGNVAIAANSSIDMNNGSLVSVAAGSGGTAGNLDILTNGKFTLNQSQATVSSPAGQAGNLTVRANGLFVDQGVLTADTSGGNGANIDVQLSGTDPLMFRNGSLISANARGIATGGNIKINAPFIIGIPQENSDITANAEQGDGGRINIVSNGVFGLRFRPRLTPFSDITASSQSGSSGTVNIVTLGIDPSQGLTALPAGLVDASQQVTQGCSARASGQGGRFTVTGRGGLPPTPEEALSSDAVWEDVPSASANQATTKPASTKPASTSRATTSESVQTQSQKDGSILLTAKVPATTCYRGE